MAFVLALVLLPAVEDAQAEGVGLHLLHLDAPEAAALPIGRARLHGAVAVQPHDVAAAVLPVHKLPDDREPALQSAHCADAAGEVQILALEDDAGIAGHLHGDAAFWGEERVPHWGFTVSMAPSSQMTQEEGCKPNPMTLTVKVKGAKAF